METRFLLFFVHRGSAGAPSGREGAQEAVDGVFRPPAPRRGVGVGAVYGTAAFRKSKPTIMPRSSSAITCGSSCLELAALAGPAQPLRQPILQCGDPILVDLPGLVGKPVRLGIYQGRQVWIT